MAEQSNSQHDEDSGFLLDATNSLNVPALITLEQTEPGPPEPGRLMAARDDNEAVAAYLDNRCRKPATRKAVLRDLRKLGFFMSWRGIERLSDFSIERCGQFQQWLLNPPSTHCLQPPEDLQDEQPVQKIRFQPFILKSGHLNPDWRPFVGPLSPQATDQTIGKIKALFGWLTDLLYLPGNPWRGLDSAAAFRTIDQQTRELPIRCIQVILQYLKEAEQNAGDPKSKKRLAHQRWIFLLYLFTGSRATACTRATIEDIQFDRKGVLQLTLKVKGKGDATHRVPWIDALQYEHRRYQSAMGLRPGTTNHLILSLRDPMKDQPVSYNSIQYNIKQLFRNAAGWAEFNTDLESWEIDLLLDASAHWIRHGAATLLDEHAQHQLGHTSAAMTARYQHEDLNERVNALNSLSTAVLKS